LGLQGVNMSTVRANNYYDASGGSAAQLYGVSMRNGGTAWVNRIINGDMRIDQRNAGASVTPANGNYTLDRWQYEASQASKFTVQRNAGSVTPPAGFTNYLGMTVASAVSVGASDYFILEQRIEGLNVADLAWGTASASSITLSFWVRSSLTGTFSGGLANSAYNRAYVFSYSISSANTWEQKTITVPGDTTGTWLTDNGIGIQLRFSLGAGSTYSASAGSWGTTAAWNVTGGVSVVGTNGATFYITGVQLEAGTVASPFERRDYGRELMMCERYYQKTYNTDSAVGSITTVGAAIARASASSSTFFLELQRFAQVAMRATPTVTAYSTATGTAGRVHVSGSDVTVSAVNDVGMNSFGYPQIASTPTGGADVRCQYVASAEL
jgi:hypothetical protein